MSHARTYTAQEFAHQLEIRIDLDERFGLREVTSTPTQQWVQIERVDGGVSWSPVFRLATACDYVPIEEDRDAIVFAGEDDTTRQLLERNGPDEAVAERTVSKD